MPAHGRGRAAEQPPTAQLAACFWWAGTRAAAIPPAAPPGSPSQPTTAARLRNVTADRFMAAPPGTLLRVIRLLLRLGVLGLAAFGGYVLYLRLGHS